MKGDFSRLRFEKEKHYSNVLMQQGRVQLDADWNEQQYIQQHRIETGTKDIVGLCGTPENDLQLKERYLFSWDNVPGNESDNFKEFLQKNYKVEVTHLKKTDDKIIEISDGQHSLSFELNDKKLKATKALLKFEGNTIDEFVAKMENDKLNIYYKERNSGFKITLLDNKLYIGEGRYYADGILCENESDIAYIDQKDFFPKKEVIEVLSGAVATVGIVYLDVWKHHVTALEDKNIREKALGGPDTTTRIKTIWQVRILPIKTIDANTAACNIPSKEWIAATAPGTGKLNARIKPSSDTEDLCLLKPKTTYQRLENQLYRIEVHNGGEPYSWPRPAGIEATNATALKGVNNKLIVKKWIIGNVPFRIGQLVEVFSAEIDRQEKAGKLANIEDADEATNTLTLSIDISDLPGFPNLQIRKVASFKWSRDNGSVATSIESISDNKVTVEDVGKDEVLGFADGQWVEILDDRMELNYQRGHLVQIDNIDPSTRVITMKTTPPAVDTMQHPKLRRWDQTGVSAIQGGLSITSEWVAIEDGIEMKFSEGSYKNGDYWTIPARTVTGELEWPPYEVPNKNPVSQPPFGIQHHYCRLALLKKISGEWKIEDCRQFFPAVTELTSIFYISGDGQEAMPEKKLPELLKVGVANGQWPMEGALVKFEIMEGGGTLKAGKKSLIVETRTDGVADCEWTLGAFHPTVQDYTPPLQQVKATLMDKDGNEKIRLPIFFNANLSVAGQVAYFPQDCTNMSATTTVQNAIDKLSELTSLFYVGGDGQEAMPGNKLPKLLSVGVANKCGPKENALVQFDIMVGCGTLEAKNPFRINPLIVKTGPDGIAKCDWILGIVPQPSQCVIATLRNDDGTKANVLPVYFNANLSVANEVAYDPKSCTYLKDVKTIQQAIEKLCPPAIHVAKISLLDETVKMYLFNWDNVPGNEENKNDENKLKEFLKENYKVKVKNFEKSDDEKTINISDGPHSLSIELNGEKLNATKAVLKINNNRTDEFIVKVEENHPNIYILRTLHNDTNVTIESMEKGIKIRCVAENLKGELIIDKISPATCYVTLDMPFSFYKTLIGFQPLILDANPRVDGNVILWEPTRLTELFDALKEKFDENIPNRILAHLTLKGDFIWAKDNPELYLDGEIFGFKEEDRKNIDVRLPSGNGRHGGNFEMWFWIVKEPQFDSFDIKPDSVVGGEKEEIKGTVTLSGPAPEGGNVIGLGSSSDSTKLLPNEIIFEGEKVSETFNIETSEVNTNQEVTITAYFKENEKKFKDCTLNIKIKTSTASLKEEKKIKRPKLRSKGKEDWWEMMKRGAGKPVNV